MITWLKGNPHVDHAATTGDLEKKSVLDQKASSPFFAANAERYETLLEFSNALMHMDEAVFAHHVTEQKNDFANWLEACFPPAVAGLGTVLRGKNREEAIRLLVAFSQGKSLETTSQPSQQESATSKTTRPLDSTVHQIATFGETGQQNEIKQKETKTTSTPQHASQIHTKHSHQNQNKHNSPTQYHHTPLPPSPLEQMQERRLHRLLDDIHAVQMQALVDPILARETFISLRTKVWHDLTEEERRTVLPKLREAYDALKTKPITVQR